MGYTLSAVGEYGNTAHLRRDAQALAAATHHAVADYGSLRYLAAQQIGMRHDVSWDFASSRMGRGMSKSWMLPRLTHCLLLPIGRG